MANKLPSMAVRNALAFVAWRGHYPSHVAQRTRLDASPFVDFNYDDENRRSTGRHYNLNERGQAAAKRSTLAPAIDYLTTRGFELDHRRVRGRSPKPGFMAFRNRETDQTAFISGGARVYVNEPGKIGATLAFEAKAARS